MVYVSQDLNVEDNFSAILRFDQEIAALQHHGFVFSFFFLWVNEIALLITFYLIIQINDLSSYFFFKDN